MNLEDARENYYFYSGKASDIVRQLGLAGIAIIWVFKNGGSVTTGLLPREFLWPGVLVVATLGFDLIQYVSGTLAWGIYRRLRELEGIDAKMEFRAPRWINWATLTFFVLKTLSIIVAYFLLARVLINRLF